jgi:hypothetical protein
MVEVHRTVCGASAGAWIAQGCARTDSSEGITRPWKAADRMRDRRDEAMRAVKVGLPPKLDEQICITAAMDSTASSIVATERRRDERTDVFRTLIHELMTGKVRTN